MKERKHSEKTRAKISKSIKEQRSEGAGKPCQKIEVVDIKNNIKTKYNSISEAALELDIKQSQISLFFRRNQNKPIQGRYIFKKV